MSDNHPGENIRSIASSLRILDNNSVSLMLYRPEYIDEEFLETVSFHIKDIILNSLKICEIYDIDAYRLMDEVVDDL